MLIFKRSVWWTLVQYFTTVTVRVSDGWTPLVGEQEREEVIVITRMFLVMMMFSFNYDNMKINFGMRRYSKHSCCSRCSQILVEYFIYHLYLISGFTNSVSLSQGTFRYVHLSTCPCTSSSITCMALTTTWRQKDFCNPLLMTFFSSPLLLPLPENDGPRPA